MPQKPERPWKRRYELPDGSVHEAAGQFRDATQLLLARLEQENDVLLPFLNVAAVTIELYLKSLSTDLNFVVQDGGGDIVYSAPNNHGHEPSVLLKGVSPEVRHRIEEAFGAWPGSGGESLAQRCGSYDRLFSGSRYSFEEGQNVSGIRLSRLMDLIEFLKTFVDHLPPEERIEWPDWAAQ